MLECAEADFLQSRISHMLAKDGYVALKSKKRKTDGDGVIERHI